MADSRVAVPMASAASMVVVAAFTAVADSTVAAGPTVVAVGTVDAGNEDHRSSGGAGILASPFVFAASVAAGKENFSSADLRGWNAD